MVEIRSKDIRLVPIGEIKLNPKNRNSHSKEQIDRLAQIIKYQGFRNPGVVSNRTGILIAGEGRYLAAKQLGLEAIPCIFQDFDDETQEFTYGVSDNSISSWSELDLSGINADIGDFGPFDLDLLGIKNFTVDVADKLGECDEDEIPEHVEPRTKLGDIYKLGNHRLMCGDSTSIDAVERLMDGEKADSVFTDPPYNIDFKPPRGTHDKILNDSMGQEEFKDWLGEVFACASAVTKEDSFAFVWSGWSTIDQFAPALRNFYEVKAIHIWVKNNFGIGYYSRPKYEPFFLCLKGKPPVPAKAPADVWEHAKVHTTIHSCEKPVGLIEEIVGTYGIKGAVLDLFGGSGSTLIACEKTNRKCYMAELDPKYCDIIIARWELFSGQKAELLTQQEVVNG